MTTLSGHTSRQRPDELAAFIDILKRENVRSYLEIGACHGDTFHAVMSALPRGSKGVAIDLPEAAWGKTASREALERAVTSLQEAGYNASAIFGNSASAGVRQLAIARGPYDAILIDADHTYPAVQADWNAFGAMGRIIAFHDIDGNGNRFAGKRVEVPRLWHEIKATYRHTEIIGEARGMGIGVIWR